MAKNTEAVISTEVTFAFSCAVYQAVARLRQKFLPGMVLPRIAWALLNRLRACVERFNSCLHKWGVAPSAACECGAKDQTVDRVLLHCPIHRPPRGLHGLAVLDDETISGYSTPA